MTADWKTPCTCRRYPYGEPLPDPADFVGKRVRAFFYHNNHILSGERAHYSEGVVETIVECGVDGPTCGLFPDECGPRYAIRVDLTVWEGCVDRPAAGEYAYPRVNGSTKPTRLHFADSVRLIG